MEKIFNPAQAISEEIEKARQAPGHAGLLSYRPANDWVTAGLNSPDPKMYFHDLIVQYENTVIFAASNVRISEHYHPRFQ